jgi:hypothetical protein
MCRPKDEIKNPTRPRSRPRSRELKRMEYVEKLKICVLYGTEFILN